jgi:hypothetical protein
VKHALTLVLLLGTIFAAHSAYAADTIVGTWKLNVAKSKFSPGPAPKAGTRVYTESAGLYTLDQKVTAADGKENSLHVQYRDGQEVKQPTGASVDATVAKRVDANTWDFDIKTEGKAVGHVHRVVSADGKVLTVHNTGRQGNVAPADDTMVFDKQ